MPCSARLAPGSRSVLATAGCWGAPACVGTGYHSKPHVGTETPPGHRLRVQRSASRITSRASKFPLPHRRPGGGPSWCSPPQVQRNGLRTSNALASRARRAILPRGGRTAGLDASQVPPETSGPLAALRRPSGRSVAGSDRPSLMASKKLRPACGGGTEPSILQPFPIATHGWRRADGT